MSTVRISVPENVELGLPLYGADAHDADARKNGQVTYRLLNVGNNGGGGVVAASSSSLSSSSSSTPMPSTSLFAIDAQTGHLTLQRHLDYEAAQRHSLIVTATDLGDPPLSSNLTVLVEVQDINDNPPVFERNEYTVKVIESMPVQSQVWFFLNVILFITFQII